MDLDPADPRSAVYVDLNTMTVTQLSGQIIPITNMIDENGDECLDPDEAVIVVAGSFEQGWFTVPLPWVDDDPLSIH